MNQGLSVNRMKFYIFFITVVAPPCLNRVTPMKSILKTIPATMMKANQLKEANIIEF